MTINEHVALLDGSAWKILRDEYPLLVCLKHEEYRIFNNTVPIYFPIMDALRINNIAGNEFNYYNDN